MRTGEKMHYLGMNDLRSRFLDFFESQEHTRLQSFSLVPDGDDSLLLINAGMAPLKAYFLGEKKMAHNRATSSQRCVRTADIDNVGKTDRHATFFEMLGNFSFGDYFKKEAIHWAWTFLTDIIQLDPARMWITVFEEDQQAYDIWTKQIGIAPDHMLRLGKDDNFWELEQGPCGPCSEIHYDRGEKFGEGSNPTENSDRFMEVWNLVFTQFNRGADGNYTPLAHPNIDTGMGLERLALVCEDKANIFELDEFLPLRGKIAQLSGKNYGEDPRTDESFRVIIDHSKAIAFLTLDGVVPSNEGRGYILRRLLRRAARHGKLLGIQGNFLTATIEEVMKVYADAYPELLEAKDRIFTVVTREEDNFEQTIDQGLQLLENLIDEAEKQQEKTLDGERVFRLYDTFGFPLDLTKEIAAERGKEVDEADFHSRMEQQRNQSRARRKESSGWDTKTGLSLDIHEKTIFTGYETIDDTGRVLALFQEKEPVEELTGEGIVVFDRTPFYAEGGGQVADHGELTSEGVQASVLDVQKNKEEVILHTVRVEKGSLHIGDNLTLRVEADRRNDVRRNHTATHLLNKALRMVLGDHVQQAGSLVEPERLRFDFTHYQAMTPEEVKRVEEIVNRAIYDSYPVTTQVMPLEEAMQSGAIGLFEEKYQDEVRVLSIGDFEVELCGGTHVGNSSQVQMFRILSEQGVSSGVRRIEAITGRAIYQQMLATEREQEKENEILSATKENRFARLESLLSENRELKKQVADFREQEANRLSQQVINSGQEIAGVLLIAKRLDGKSMNELKDVADALKENHTNEVIALASATESKVFWVVSIGKELIEKGLKAGDLVKYLAQQTGGNGGGRPNFATAGGKDASRIDDAITSIPHWLEEKLN